MNIRSLTQIVGALALGLLFITSCQQPAADSGTADTAATNTSSNAGKIVFVRQDSVIENYTALQEKLEKLTDKYQVLDEEQQNRLSSFQRQVASFQQRAQSGQMAPKNIQSEQEQLALREQQLMQDANRLQQESQMEQLQLMSIFQENVQDVLKAIQDEAGYDYILNYGSGTGVLMVNDVFDITDEVLTRLNKLSMDPPAEEGEGETEGEEASEE